ncbi:MAG: phosphatase PAP2 family protein [Anaerolineales bacterium]
MDSLTAAEIHIISFLQQIGQSWMPLMRFFTFLGKEQFYLLLMPLLYWTIDSRLGIQLGVMLTLSSSLNDLLKLGFHSPRPFWVSASVRAVEYEGSFGIPSGHAQISASIWGLLAGKLKRSWIWGIAVFLILMIGISRLFLGVHFLRDVLSGWLIGALLVWVFLRWEKPLLDSFKQGSYFRQNGALFLVSMGIILIGVLERFFLRSWHVPGEWMQGALASQTASESFYPMTISGVITSAAAFFGLTSGSLWIERKGGFDKAQQVWQGLLRFLIGLIGVLLFWFGLDLLFPSGESFLPAILRYARYTLVGFWIAGGAPWIFIQLSIAEKRSL